MDTKQTEINIPEVEYGGSDHKLLERVKKFKVGSMRIIVFTLVGMLLGWFSYTYTQDSFIITKAIMAVPYKISEAIYLSIIGIDNNTVDNSYAMYFTEFFNQSWLASFMAERITPVLIGGALYGALGYFSGDKRVFTMQRFVKFVCAWAAVILVYIGCVYGVNAKAVSDNENMKGISYFFVYAPMQGEAVMDDRAEKMLLEFESELSRDQTIKRNYEDEHEMSIIYDNGLRSMLTYVNWNENYLATETGVTYHISEEFDGYVKEYYETGSLMGVQNITVESEGEDEDE